jgi:chromosomal replication initiator protein
LICFLKERHETLLEPADAWIATQGHLEVQLHKATYNTWVKPTRFVSFEAGIFTLAVPNAYTKDWLEQRLQRTIKRVLENVMRQDVQVQYIIQSPTRSKVAPTIEVSPELDPQTTPRSLDEMLRPVELSAPVRAPSLPMQWGETLNHDFTLQNFIQSSQMVNSAAQAALQKPGRAYNPLYFHSRIGLGKTHLLQAIGNAYNAQGLNVLYVNAETFTNDLVRAIRTQQMDLFRAQYRGADVLIVDDVQFLAGKVSSQEEFFHTFNALHNLNRQMVFSGNCAPKDIEGLDERLASRFDAGLCVELLRPDLQTRLAILKSKALAQGIDLPHATGLTLANEVRSSVRDLEGALNRVLAEMALGRGSLSPESLASVIRSVKDSKKKIDMEIEAILEGTARYHQMALDDLLSKQRHQQVAQARHMAIYIAREDAGASTSDVARIMGARSHSTIINSYRKAAELMDNDPLFRRRIHELRQYLHDPQY